MTFFFGGRGGAESSTFIRKIVKASVGIGLSCSVIPKLTLLSGKQRHCQAPTFSSTADISIPIVKDYTEENLLCYLK